MSSQVSHAEFQQWMTWINEIDWSAYNASALDDAAATVSSEESELFPSPEAHYTSTRSPSDESHAAGQEQKRNWSDVVCTSSRASGKVAKLALRCTTEGCTYTKTFAGNYELDRHVTTAHKREKPFWCPVKGCFKGNAAPSFARSDKLTSHIRACHNGNAMTDCPHDGCSVTLPLDLLGPHIKVGHHWYRQAAMDSSGKHCAALVHAADTNSQKCLYWPCSKKLRFEDLFQHLQSHSVAELEYMAVELRAGGYVFTLPSHPEELAKIWVVCPVCHEFSAGHDDFAKHLLFSHITNPGKPDSKTLTLLDNNLMSQFFRDDWTSYIGLTDRKKRNVDRHCHGCGQDVEARSMRRHDCGIMRNKDDIIAELRPHRQALLRLCPDFAACEFIFEDLISTES